MGPIDCPETPVSNYYNSLPKFRDKLLVPSSGLKNPIILDSWRWTMVVIGCPETSVWNYQYFAA